MTDIDPWLIGAVILGVISVPITSWLLFDIVRAHITVRRRIKRPHDR
jgi:hypothetical protein